MSETQKTEKSGIGNGAIVAICCSFVIGMVGMAYAAVPLYEMFCKVTGYGGTTQRVEQASDVILDRTIKVRFDANVGPGLAWSFEPVQREVELKIGETVPECLASDLAVEVAGRVDQIEGIRECEATGDYATREILREILSDTEEHIDFLETQLNLVRTLGEQNYLQSALGELEGGEGH